ncbi:hypothetical protein GCM10010171_39110 [Actinokineospora fastidiosa]|uniref:Uncharacterized protein n=1 Tax=Actinokineospora fastidiosa TaxID=1816 RepID=A0A918GK74_9PSEU|nr:hypothetical protein GCM10010171_39110 [Actinokineospora fastidiosa]
MPVTDLGQATGTTSVMVPGFLLGALAAATLAASGAVAEAGGWALAGLAITALAAGLTAASLVDLTAINGPMSGYAHVNATRGAWAARFTGVLGVAGRIVAAGALAAFAGPAVLPSAPRVVSVVIVVLAGALVIARVRPPAWALYVVIVTVGLVVATCLLIVPVVPGGATVDVAGADDWRGTAAAAGVLFLGLAGVERVSGGGMGRALGAVACGVAVVGVVVFALFRQLGGPRMAVSPAPLRDALAAADGAALTPLLVVGVAALAVLAVRPLLADAARVVDEMPELPSRAAVAVVAAAALAALLLPPAFAVTLAVTLLLAYYAMVNSAARLLVRSERSSWVRSGCCGLALCVVLSVNVSVPALLVGAGVLAIGGIACWASSHRHIE